MIGETYTKQELHSILENFLLEVLAYNLLHCSSISLLSSAVEKVAVGDNLSEIESKLGGKAGEDFNRPLI